ncbi:acyltransferase family protein [Paracoccus sp. 11-3]|uniref:Acyltransferase family protein n=1 Tax=Paracoccus amoyensis TaxID=2760093 RepID=A0A926GDG9_9RHOB|nr:acyltransferase family protein [Paracoccus amoyensis]MBC9248016.1 acyltransferase family protein [Paracoccus amoyensis]
MNAAVQRNSAVDPLRVLLAIFVIGIHTGFPDALQGEVKQALVNGLYRTAVPIFSLISGFFFASAAHSGRGAGYLKRILILYAIWMVIYAPVYGPEITSLPHLLQLWFFGYFHLWFLAGMIAAGALLLALIHWKLPIRGIVLIALLLAAVGILLQYLVLSERLSLQLDLYRNGLFVIFPFFAVGYALAATGTRKTGTGGKWLAVLSVIAVMAESVVWYRIAGGTYGVDSMVTLLACAPLVFLAALSSKGFSQGKQLATLAAFIYFSHVLAMITATQLGISGDLKFVFVVVLCLLVWWSLGRFSFGQRILASIT